MDFIEFAPKVYKSRNTVCPVSKDTITLCFDPGHTTGYAVFKGLKLYVSGELITKPIETAVHAIKEVMDLWEPDIVVIEDYRVFKNKTQQHGGSELLTTRVIGCIETFCTIKMVANTIKQPPHLAKGFCKDSRLKYWGLYKIGERHARDAIRHGCYFLLFGAINSKESQHLPTPKGTVG